MIMRGSMRSVWVASAFLGLLVSTTAANAAGVQALTVAPDSSASPALVDAVWYPCAMTPTAMKLGGRVVSAVKDCPVTGDKLPLVVISHGRTGSFLGHHDTAAGLGSRRLRRGRRLASRRQRTGREPQPPAVRVPIQLWRSERGGGGVTPESVAAVAEALPVKTTVRTVPNAQHFAFLPPCPDELARSAQELCTDPPGFDRETFHTEFNAQVLDFFRRSLR
jgi:predicted dienelactone hydrolase